MFWTIMVGIIALLVGVVLGFFIARKYMVNYLKKNPPINEQMLRVMMNQMGQHPSQKKLNQMMKAINSRMK
ncbi:MAG: YneF family protein [Sporolactobacillus sp.]|nr:YneF family protein [Sporolactobacillus sp.]MCI1882250.1 YneF family protein [Sporolactobacillus sp.]